MEKLQEIISNFTNIALKILLSIILISSVGFSIVMQVLNLGNGGIGIVTFFILISFSFFYLLKRELNYKKILIGIVIWGTIIRLVWNLKVNTLPYSDFELMYQCSRKILEGDFTMFKGTEYFARFPHLTILVLYFSIIRLLFSNPLVAIKVANIILGSVSIVFIYLIVKEVFNSKKKGIIGAYLAAIYPPFITYSSVIVGENIAIPLFLVSVYLFIKFVKYNKSIVILICSGVILSIGNWFRMVATILLIAYILYIVIYSDMTLKKRLISIISIVMAFIIPLVLVSNILKFVGITEYSMWKGAESNWTSILKGTNITNIGRWNEDDASIAEKYNYDYEIVKEVSKKIVVERLRTTPIPMLGAFYIAKFSTQWMSRDFGGTYWSTIARDNSSKEIKFANSTTLYVNVFYTVLLLLIVLGVFNKNSIKNKELNLLYIILGGFMIQCLITENQVRYGYIASWILLILPFTLNKFDLTSLMDKIKKK